MIPFSPSASPRDWAIALLAIVRIVRHYSCQVMLMIVLGGMGLSLYSLVQNGGQILPGVKLAVETDAGEQLRAQRAAEVASVQAALKLTVRTDHLVNEALAALVDDTPRAIRARIALVHDGVFTTNGVHLMHFSITNAASVRGHDLGEFVQNVALSEWSGFLSSIIDRPGCTVVRPGDPVGSKLRSNPAESFLVCGIFSSRMQFLGGLFLSFDRPEDLPAGAEREAALARERAAATAIGVALEARAGL